jgi:hypothetical protein
MCSWDTKIAQISDGDSPIEHNASAILLPLNPASTSSFVFSVPTNMALPLLPLNKLQIFILISP